MILITRLILCRTQMIILLSHMAVLQRILKSTAADNKWSRNAIFTVILKRPSQGKMWFCFGLEMTFLPPLAYLLSLFFISVLFLEWWVFFYIFSAKNAVTFFIFIEKSTTSWTRCLYVYTTSSFKILPQDLSLICLLSRMLTNDWDSKPLKIA